MNERFKDNRPGDRLTASEVNAIKDAIERHGATGAGPGGIDAGTFRAGTPPGGRAWKMVRMASEYVEVDHSIHMGEGEIVEQLFNAVEQEWDEASQAWRDSSGGELTVELPYGQAFDRDQLMVAVLVGERWVGLANHTTRLAVTCKTSTGLALDEVTVGWYPAEEDEPNVYPVTFVNVPFPSVPGAWPLAEYGELAAEGEVPIVDMGTPGPHALVMNLTQGEETFIPEGTLIDCFQAGNRWFTRTGAVATGESAGSTSCNKGLAKLKTTDCIEARWDTDSVILSYDSGTGHWLSGLPLLYPGSEGYVDFWFEKGAIHLKLGKSSGSGEPVMLELLNCGNGNFQGGPLTGHIDEDSEDSGVACEGQTFTVGLNCMECPPPPTYVSQCCPEAQWPETLFLTITDGGDCNGTCELVYLDSTVGYPRWRRIGELNGFTDVQITFYCNGIEGSPAVLEIGPGQNSVLIQCSPLIAVFNMTGISYCDPTSITCTVTE